MITKKNAKELGLEFVGYTSIWNYHNSRGLVSAISDKRSNIFKSINELKEKGEKGGFTLQVQRIGRSQHDETIVAIYKGTVSAAEYGSSFYSNKNAEFFIQ